MEDFRLPPVLECAIFRVCRLISLGLTALAIGFFSNCSYAQSGIFNSLKVATKTVLNGKDDGNINIFTIYYQKGFPGAKDQCTIASIRIYTANCKEPNYSADIIGVPDFYSSDKNLTCNVKLLDNGLEHVTMMDGGGDNLSISLINDQKGGVQVGQFSGTSAITIPNGETWNFQYIALSSASGYVDYPLRCKALRLPAAKGISSK